MAHTPGNVLAWFYKRRTAGLVERKTGPGQVVFPHDSAWQTAGLHLVHERVGGHQTRDFWEQKEKICGVNVRQGGSYDKRDLNESCCFSPIIPVNNDLASREEKGL
jgi:hypothetical protein